MSETPRRPELRSGRTGNDESGLEHRVYAPFPTKSQEVVRIRRQRQVEHIQSNLSAVVRLPEDPEEHDTRFDWRDEDNIVCHQQPRSAVYFNLHGQVVLRQERDYHAFEDDPFVFFNVENVPALIDALRACLAPGTSKPPSAQRPQQSTTIARQRRYHARHRNGLTPQRDVTP